MPSIDKFLLTHVVINPEQIIGAMSEDEPLVFGLRRGRGISLGLLLLGTAIFIFWRCRKRRLRYDEEQRARFDSEDEEQRARIEAEDEEQRTRTEAEDHANLVARIRDGSIKFGASNPTYPPDPAPNTYTVTRPTGPPKDVSLFYRPPLGNIQSQASVNETFPCTLISSSIPNLRLGRLRIHSHMALAPLPVLMKLPRPYSLSSKTHYSTDTMEENNNSRPVSDFQTRQLSKCTMDNLSKKR